MRLAFRLAGFVVRDETDVVIVDTICTLRLWTRQSDDTLAQLPDLKARIVDDQHEDILVPAEFVDALKLIPQERDSQAILYRLPEIRHHGTLTVPFFLSGIVSGIFSDIGSSIVSRSSVVSSNEGFWTTAFWGLVRGQGRAR